MPFNIKGDIMQNKIKNLLIIIFFIGLSVILFPYPDESKECGPQKFTERLVKVNKTFLKVEVAKTICEQYQGLMNREKMTHDGMVFVLEEEGIPSFWMKDTLIPLSIAFIRADGVIVDIQDMYPSSTPDFMKKTYSPKEKVKYVLEVEQGYFLKKDIKVNDKFVF